MLVQPSGLSSTALLRLWLYGRYGRDVCRRNWLRWKALDDLVDRHEADALFSAASVPSRLAALIELGPRVEGGRRLRRLRCRAAIALVRLFAGRPPESQQLQLILARSISLALPSHLSQPRVVASLMSAAECAAELDAKNWAGC